MGRVLLDFICKQSKDTDVFCFQEAFHLIEGQVVHEGNRLVVLEEIQRELFDFKLHYHPIEDKVRLFGNPDVQGAFGQAMFIRQNINVGEVDEIMVFRDRNTLVGNDYTTIGKNLQYAQIESGNKNYLIGNLHGLWTGDGKDDTETRLEQSIKIQDFLSKRKEHKILLGDFNLNPDTESLKLLEKGMRNLIKEFNISTTRSLLYRHKGIMEFADYTLVSPGIKVKNFQVPDVAVSDHLPMILEFE